jgi:hypothetical protein
MCSVRTVRPDIQRILWWLTLAEMFPKHPFGVMRLFNDFSVFTLYYLIKHEIKSS